MSLQPLLGRVIFRPMTDLLAALAGNRTHGAASPPSPCLFWPA
ncbi:MAG: hypothetical protein WAU47_11290 [Desulfobaccales bacterium]